MNRAVFLLAIVVAFTNTAMAARAKIDSIAKDPYISALVLDADTGKVLFSDHPDALVYPASVLKLMNLFVILDQIKHGKVQLDDMVQVTSEAAKTGGSQVYLDTREQFKVEDLLYALMIQSANDAAVALASHIAGSKDGFVDLMNQKAQELGMKNTHFYSVHGLPPDAGQKPDETTASDLSILCRKLVAMPEALKYTSTKVRGFRNDTFIMRNHNHLLGEVDGCDGLKTGYFQAAGFSIAASAKRGGVRIIALVMGSANRKERDAKASELLAKGFSMEPPKPAPAVTANSSNPTVINKDAPMPVAQGLPPQPAPTSSGSSFFGEWWKFFLGAGAGLSLFLVKFLLQSRKKNRENTKNIHRQ